MLERKKVEDILKVVSVTANGLERMALRIVERKAVMLFDTDKQQWRGFAASQSATLLVTFGDKSNTIACYFVIVPIGTAN